MTTELVILGLVLHNALALEGAEQVVASVHAFPHQLELPEHRLVGDAPPVGLRDDGLDS